jgi:hypothetical protein
MDGDGEVFSFRAEGRASDMFWAVMGGAAWIAIVCVYFGGDAPPARLTRLYPFGLAAVAAGILVNAVILLRQLYGKRVTVDGRRRVVSVKRLFGRESVMTFDSASRIAPLSFRGLFTSREAYCLVPTIAPVFGARIISPILVPGGENARRFKSETIPKIEKIMGLPEPERAVKNAAAPKASPGYAEHNQRFTKSFARRYAAVFAAIALALLACCAGLAFVAFRFGPGAFGGIKKEAAALIIAASVAPFLLPMIMLLFVPVISVTFDTLKQNIEVRRGLFGWGGLKTYGLSSVRSFDVRGYGAGLDNGAVKEIRLKVCGARKPVPVMRSVAGGKGAADELRFLASLLGLDPARDMEYTLCQFNNNPFEVP